MKETVSCLLRAIPRDLWARVRALAYREQWTIQRLIVEALTHFLDDRREP